MVLGSMLALAALATLLIGYQLVAVLLGFVAFLFEGFCYQGRFC